MEAMTPLQPWHHLLKAPSHLLSMLCDAAVLLAPQGSEFESTVLLGFSITHEESRYWSEPQTGLETANQMASAISPTVVLVCLAVASVG